MSIFVTSDLHRGHKNILKYCNRTYSSIEEMEKGIIEKWNSVVRQDDTVYIMGDISIDNNKVKNTAFLSQLNGTKIVIKGNHDESALLTYLVENNVIASWHYALELKHNKCKYFLSHFPVVNPRGMFQSNSYFSIHGHLHGVKRFYTALNSIDVGWDVFDEPIPLSDIPNIIQKRVKKQSIIKYIKFGLIHLYYSVKSLLSAKKLCSQK